MSSEPSVGVDALKEELRKSIDEMDVAGIYSLAQFLNIQMRSWAHGTTNVMCSLQNNPKLISVSNSIQCSSCSLYYCDDHNLDKCPHCSHKL
jgi:hypothetical protein